jgi:glucose/mannose-6-phosphate isomerase
LTAATPAVKNPAKRLAGQLIDRIPVIWGAGLLAPVARRWKTQLNENAKTCAHFEIMPELNHNTVVGVMFPDDMLRHVAVVQLTAPEYQHPRVALRFDLTRELLLQEAIAVDVVQARGASPLAQQMTAIQYGDYVSYYLAMAYGVDPTPIPPIEMLKERLAEEKAT